ncbi:MAG: LuxR C-terminal-related transcriptional regulator, partial [Adlercreutzia sp.]|nr:LuxR C-terminal-related transcriptional regulator [Adlercreutzia sp.]
VNIAAAYALSCGLYFLVRMVDPLIAIASVVLLPAASALVLLSFGSPTDEGEEESAKDRRPSLRINPRIIIPLMALFFFALGGEMFRGFAAPAGAEVDLGFMGDWYLAGGAAGLVVLVAALEARRRLMPERRATIPNLQVVLVIMALSFLCTVLFGASFEVAYAVFGAAFMGCRCIVWAYCAGIAKRTGTSAFTVFGTAQASFALAVVVGVPLSGRLIAAVQGPVLSWDAIACTFLFLIVVVAVVATNQSDFASAWGMVPRSRVLEEGSRPAASAVHGNASGAAVSAEAVLHDDESDGEDSHEEDPLAFLQERFGLTPREREVALLLARGRSLPFVQKELHISQGTAQSHLTHIYRKMQVHSRQEFIDIIDKEMPDQNLP